MAVLSPTCRVAAVAALSFCAACAASPRSPTTSAAPSAPARVVSTATAALDAKPDSARHGYTAADVRFMHLMVAHHAQALAMTKLIPGHTSRDDMRLLGERIDVSQKGEIAMMQRWLRERGEMVPDASSSDMHRDMAGHDMAGHDMLMPGMLTAAQMDALAKASGADFDRLFLQGMIQHHEGALVMVAQLFASQGAGQEPEIFRFASDVDNDQRIEIARMRAMLGAMPNAVHDR
jgi:uncharacterized protein (DUF305 family)